MKKILTFLFVVIAPAAYAASTCETRVDSHQKATTRQRVAYCLMEEPAAAPAAGPELVYSGTYSKEPQTQSPIKSTVKDGYFKEDKYSIQHQYVGSQNFPSFKNDTLSEQERAALERAYLKELEKQQQSLDSLAVKKSTTERAPARLTAPANEQKTESNSLTNAQIARGLQTRQHKPKRIMKTPVVAASEEAVTSLEIPTATTQPEAITTNDPLLSNTNEEDLLSDELGLNDEQMMAPIPPSANQM